MENYTKLRHTKKIKRGVLQKVATLFASTELEAKRTWMEYGDIHEDDLNAWKSLIADLGFNPLKEKLMDRISGEKLKDLLRENIQLIKICNEQLESILQGMIKSVVFMVTDTAGAVIHISTAQTNMAERLDRKNGLGIGTVFTMAHTGINAITAARELQTCVFFDGAEHDMKLFDQWSCFCSPILCDGQINGYLDMSFSTNEDRFLMGAIFDLALRSIQNKLSSLCPKAGKEKVLNQLRQYRLAPREQEIAYMWLMNFSALRIAFELNITEGTVRNVIKRIYRKTEVTDKGRFIRKFMI